jgi:MoaA/NifB/PqqE/SkfB family radical SAM enzyme
MKRLRKLGEYMRVLWDVLFLPLRAHGMPRHVQLDITTRCNLNCAMCYSKKVMQPTEKNKALDFERFRKFFDEVRPLSINLAASGEPLLNEDFFAITRYAAERGCQVIISTNLTVPDAGMIDRIVDSGLGIMKISIDGATKEVYERVRGPHFDRLYANLEHLKKARDARPESRLKVRFDYVLLKTNYTDIDAIVDLAAKFGVSHIYYRICDARGWSGADKEALLADSFPEIERHMQAAVARAKEKGVSTNLPELLEKKEQWRFRHEDAARKAPPSKRPVCILPWIQLSCRYWAIRVTVAAYTLCGTRTRAIFLNAAQRRPGTAKRGRRPGACSRNAGTTRCTRAAVTAYPSAGGICSIS